MFDELRFGMLRQPVIGQQVVDAGNVLLGEASKNVAQVVIGIDVAQLAGRDKTEERGGGLTSAIAAGE